MVFRLSLQILTLVASVLSCIATFAALCYVFFVRRRSQDSLRHALVINLLVAEFINSTNNSVSGLISLVNAGSLRAGSYCTANGFLGQFSVQAIDFGILSIAISTLALVSSPTHDFKPSLLYRCVACGSVWLIGLMTSCIALGLQTFGPVSGNWCWIRKDRLALRYGLAHGWRFAVILAICVIYVCITVKLCRQYSWLRRHTYGGHAGITPELTDVGQDSATRESLIPELPFENRSSRRAENDVGMSRILHVSERSRTDDLLTAPTVCGRSEDQCTTITHDQKREQSLLKIDSVQTLNAETSQTLQPSFKDPRIRVVAQMTAYPALYILLWIPGIVNRGVEASGRTSITLQYLQASTQLIGLVDTIIFAAQQRHWRTAHRA